MDENIRSLQGNKIKELRRSYSLSQQQFAERLGISHAHVSKIESNKENPSETLLKLMAYEFPEKGLLNKHQQFSPQNMNDSINSSLSILKEFFSSNKDFPDDLHASTMFFFDLLVTYFEIAQQNFAVYGNFINVFYEVVSEITVVVEKAYNSEGKLLGKQSLSTSINIAKRELPDILEMAFELLDKLKE